MQKRKTKSRKNSIGKCERKKDRRESRNGAKCKKPWGNSFRNFTNATAMFAFEMELNKIVQRMYILQLTFSFFDSSNESNFPDAWNTYGKECCMFEYTSINRMFKRHRKSFKHFSLALSGEKVTFDFANSRGEIQSLQTETQMLLSSLLSTLWKLLFQRINFHKVHTSLSLYGF